MAERRAAEIIQTWLDGAPPDAAGAIEEHPNLSADKGIVLDLAFAEFLIREHQGARPDIEEFCSRFPNYHASLGRMLAQQSVGNRPNELDAALPNAFGEQTITTPVTPVRGTDPGLFIRAGSTARPPKSPGSTPTPNRHPGPHGWPESGERVGDFDLLRQLGKGSFGRVFLALEETTSRHVVVKLTRQKCDEAKVLGRLGHRNVVSVLSAPHDATSGFYLVVMPYHGSSTLEDLLELAHPLRRVGKNRPRRAEIIVAAARRNLHPSDPVPSDLKADPFLKRAGFTDGIVWLGVRIAEALSAVHECGFVHHDLKPSNVLLGLDGHPRVLDFNLASDVRSTKSRLGGTLPYMPPEHLRAAKDSNSVATMDARGDIYSFGVIMYELLAGRHPFGRFPRSRSVRTVADEMLARQKLGLRPLRERNPEVPHRLAQLVERCLSFEQEDRPQTASAVALEMRQCYSTRKRAMQFLSSRPGRVAVTSAAIGIVSAATWMASAQARPEFQTPDHRSIGMTALANGRYGDAVPDLTEATKRAPLDAEVWLALGRAKSAQQQWSSALLDLEKAAELRPEHGPTQATLAHCRAKLGHFAQAHLALNKAEAVRYTPAGLYALQGFCHTSRREDQLAEAALSRALELNPNQRAALVNRAHLALAQAMGNMRVPTLQGVSDVERALKAGPPDANVAHWAARFYGWMAHKPSHVKGEWYPDAASAKNRCRELLQEAVEGGIPESTWKQDSTFRFLLGDPAVFAKDWAVPTKEADLSGNWRTGDPLVEFPG